MSVGRRLVLSSQLSGVSIPAVRSFADASQASMAAASAMGQIGAHTAMQHAPLQSNRRLEVQHRPQSASLVNPPEVVTHYGVGWPGPSLDEGPAYD